MMIHSKMVNITISSFVYGANQDCFNTRISTSIGDSRTNVTQWSVSGQGTSVCTSNHMFLRAIWDK